MDSNVRKRAVKMGFLGAPYHTWACRQFVWMDECILDCIKWTSRWTTRIPYIFNIKTYPFKSLVQSHKLAIDWANFYNALAVGLTYCGGFPERLFTVTTKEEGSSTVKAGLLLAAGLTGTIRNTMNLYDIHALLTQNDRHLVIALLIGCAAAHRGTSEVHVRRPFSIIGRVYFMLNYFVL